MKSGFAENHVPDFGPVKFVPQIKIKFLAKRSNNNVTNQIIGISQV